MIELKKPEESELWASDPAEYQCALKEYERACKELAVGALEHLLIKADSNSKDLAKQVLAKIRESEKGGDA